MKLKALAAHCYDLRFQRPATDQIRAKVLQVAKREGVGMDATQADKLIESSGNDVRQVINIL